jgi:hypothetical protein
MRLAGQVARIGDKRGKYRVLVGRHEGRNHLKDLAVDGRIILKWISKKWDGKAWTGLPWRRDRWRALVNAVMDLRVP